MSHLSVGVKYCGHCNPTVEGPPVIDQMRRMDPEVAFVAWDDPDKDILLIFSGCATDCVNKPEFFGPVVHVAGCTLEHQRILLGELPAAILKALREKEVKHGGHSG